LLAGMVSAARQQHAMAMETKSASSPDVCYGVLVRRLAAAGVRPTRQRLDLARAIFAAGNRHFHRRDDLSRDAGRSSSHRRWARFTTRSTNFRAAGCCGRSRSTDAKLWYDTKTGPHYHFYREDTEELSDIPENFLPEFEIPAPDGTSIAAIDVIVRLRKL